MQISSNYIDYLGHVNRPVPLKLSVRTTDTIHGLEYTTRVMELRTFPAHCNTFGPLDLEFAGVFARMSRKPRKGQLQTFEK